MIKKYKKFIESISGTMDTMPYGPGFPRQELRPTITNQDSVVIAADDGKMYTTNDYNDIYEDYLKICPNKPLNGFTKENLEEVLTKIKKPL